MIDLGLKASFQTDGNPECLESELLSTIDEVASEDMTVVVDCSVASGDILGPPLDEVIETELKRFFVLKRLCAESGLSHTINAGDLAPSVQVDKLWHGFIARTPQYHDFCDRVFGSYLHHDYGTSSPPKDLTTMLGHLTHYFDGVDTTIWVAPLENCWPLTAPMA